MKKSNRNRFFAFASAGAFAVSVIALAAYSKPTEACGGADKVKTASFKVQGMTCTSCAGKITKALKTTKGVYSAKATYNPPRAVVTYNRYYLNPSQIIQVIAKAGFKASQTPTGSASTWQ